MTQPVPDSVGFVVIGRNEGSRLEKCLRSVLEMSNQVVYADSASSDGSLATAERLGVAVTSVGPEGRLTAARGRNAGYLELRRRFPQCRFVQFLDGDCILQPQWIKIALSFLEDHSEVALVCGRRFEAHPNASIYNLICDHEWDTPIGEANECGGDALVRCKAFDEVGGYRAELQAGEEPEMTARMRAAGWRIWRVDCPMTEHDAKMLSFGQWWRRAQRGGYGYAQVWSVTGELPKRLYDRQLRSAVLWAVAFPATLIVAAIVGKSPALLFLLPAVYGLQLIRIATREHERDRWARAGLMLLAKVPECLGAARFLIARHKSVPEYK